MNLDFSTYGYTFWIYTLCMASFDLKILCQSGAVERASKAFGLSNTWPEPSPFFNNNYAGPPLTHSLWFFGYLTHWLVQRNQQNELQPFWQDRRSPQRVMKFWRWHVRAFAGGGHWSIWVSTWIKIQICWVNERKSNWIDLQTYHVKKMGQVHKK